MAIVQKQKESVKMIKDYIHEVKAIQYTGVNRDEIKEFLEGGGHYYEEEDLIILFDGGGELEVNPADYVIKEPSGHVYALDTIKFEEDYRENEPCEGVPANDEWKRNRSFSTALDWLKQGKKVARKGWNGKGMYIWLVPEATVPKEWIKDKGLLEAIGENESMECLGFIRMKTADGRILSGWLASQTDMLSEDWEIYEEE